MDPERDAAGLISLQPGGARFSGHFSLFTGFAGLPVDRSLRYCKR
jgi:hypothetical protein